MSDLQTLTDEPSASSRAPLDPRFALLLDVPGPITVQDASGRLLFANELAAQLCGFPAPEVMLSAKLEDWLSRFELLDEERRPLDWSELPGRRVLAGQDAPERLICFRTGGDERWAWVSARRIRGSDPPLAINAFRDATAVVQAEQRIAEELRLNRALQNVALALASELDHDKLVQRITDEATAICEAQFGAFFHNVEREDGESYMLYTLSGAPRSAFERFAQPRATPVFAPTFRGEGIVRSADITQDPRYGQLGPHHGMPRGHLPVVSYLAVPVRSATGEVLGGLFFGHPEPNRFSEAHERAVAAIASHAAIALDKARLFQQVRRNQARLSAERARFAELLQQAPAAIAVLRGPELIYDIANPRYLALVGRDPSLIGKSIREAFPEAQGQGIFEACDRVFATGEPFVIHEMPIAFDRGRGIPEQGWFAVSITPVREEGAVVGIMSVSIEVTEQVRARREIEGLANALAHSERRFRSLVEASSQMVWTTSPDGEVREDSPSWRAFTGQSYDEWRGHGWLDAVHPQDRSRASRAWHDAVRRRSKFEVDYRLRRADGSYAYTLARGTPMTDERGEVQEWIGLNIDISDRVRVEDALRENERKLRLALDAGRMGTWEYDIAEQRVHWSARIEQIHGIPVGSFDGTFETYQSDIHPEDREWVLETTARNIREGREHKLLYRIVRPDGAVRWLEAFGAFVRDAAGQPAKLVGVCSDVTERIEAHEAKNALRIQKMLEGISDGFAVYDRKWNILFANQSSAARLGLNPSDLIGKNLWELLPDLLGTRFQTELEQVLATDQPATFEEYYAPLDLWVDVHAYPIAELGIAVYSRDVTLRHRDQALQRRLAQYNELRAEVGTALSLKQGLRAILQRSCEAIVERLPVSFARVWLLDAAGEYLELQASAGKYTHLDGAHARVRLGELKIGRIAAERRPRLTNDVQHEPSIGDPEWAQREGMVAFAGYPLVVNDVTIGVLAAFATESLPEDTLVALGSVGDAIAQGVERRRAELALEEHARELARSNADLEQFAYVASHDLQEPLRMVASYVQLLERRYKDKLDDDARDFIGFAVEGVTRMRGLIEDLLAYSRVGTRGRVPTAIQLDEVVTTAEKNLERAIADSGAVITRDELPQLLADQAQLVQLFQNLIGNAIKFRRQEPPRVHVGARRDGKDWVLSVADNGLGIDPRYFERIFVIFQRLNPREQYPGSGIGLAIAKKIVERHGGRIWVESTPGQGSTIAFTLPVTPRVRKGPSDD